MSDPELFDALAEELLVGSGFVMCLCWFKRFFCQVSGFPLAFSLCSMFLLFFSFLLLLFFLLNPLLQLLDNVFDFDVWIAKDQKKLLLVTGNVMILM